MKERIRESIDKSEKILLLTHISPDGDAIGSVLSFYHYLKNINKDVSMVILEMPLVFSYLDGFKEVRDDIDGEFDLGIVFDSSSLDRVGQVNDVLSKCKKTIVIDHHRSNTGYGDYNYVIPECSSCCQVIYSLFKEWNIDIDKFIGEALINGVLTDTNGFANDNVDSETFMMASEMAKIGVDIHKIYKRVLLTKTKSRHELMKLGLERLEFFDNGKIAFTYILEEDFEKVGAIYGEHEGIVNIGINIEGVLVSIFIRENDGYSVSLRSNGTIDVGLISLSLGGGGHKMAAGCKLNDNFDEVKKLVVDTVMKEINK